MHDRWVYSVCCERTVCVYVFLFLTDVMSHSLSFTAIHLYFILEALSPSNAHAKCLGTKIKAMASNPSRLC